MDKENKISYPDFLLQKMTVESTMFSPNASEIGVVILSEKHSSGHVLRIYQLLFNTEKKHII